MILVKLQGGLGNQMFQYALGRSLSIKKKTDLALDVSSFEKDPLRKYALAPFSFSARLAATEEIRPFSRYKRRSGPWRHAWNLFMADWKKYASEKQFHFDPDIFTVDKDAYIDGYWNTEKYFKDIRPTLLKDFSLKAPAAGENKEALNTIASTSSVSVHIRRGDYANNPTTNITHGTLPNEYYQKAFALIASRVEKPVLFIFSDDMKWVKENIPLPFESHYIDWNGDQNAHEDMRLMALCKHHIIANSTFSWWGAWLSQNKDKIVIAPSKWFNQVKSGIQTKDILPEEWIKI